MALLHENSPPATLRRRAILIVDDEDLQRNQLVDCLSDLDVVIFQAGNGAEALEIIDDQVPSLAILAILARNSDVRSPGCLGAQDFSVELIHLRGLGLVMSLG